jgi:hypothetical protein
MAATSTGGALENPPVVAAPVTAPITAAIATDAASSA